MKEMFFDHEEFQAATPARNLTRQTHSSYAGSMEDKKDSASTQGKENHADSIQVELAQKDVNNFLEGIKRREAETRLKDWEIKDLQDTHSALSQLIRGIKNTLPKKEARVVLKEANKYKRRLRNTLLIKRVFGKKAENKEKVDPEANRKQWEHRFTDEERNDEEIKQMINHAVKEGFTPKFDDDEELKENTALGEAERYEKAEELLNEINNTEVELTDEKKRAIKQAHEVGKGEKGKDGTNDAVVFNYTPEQIVQKGMILAHAGFSKKEIEALIENGIAGDGDATGDGDVNPITGAPLGGTIGSTDPASSTQATPSETPPPAEPETPPQPEAQSRFANLSLDELYNAIPTIRSAQDIQQAWQRLQNIVPRMGTEAIGNQQITQISDALTNLQKAFPERRAGARGRRMGGGEVTSTAFNPAERAFYEGLPSEIINNLIEAITTETTAYSTADRRKYYNNLKRYVKYVLDNAVDPEDPHNEDKKLHIADDVRARLTSIFETPAEEVIKTDAPNEQMRDNALYLKNTVKLQDFFKDLDAETAEKGSGYLPASLNELCDLITLNYGRDFATGEKYELFNTNNEFQIQNFLAFLRARIRELDDGNPNDEIQPLTQLAVQSEMSGVNLLSIILTPRFTSTRKVRLSNSGVGAEVHADLGPLQENEDLKEGKWIFLREAWMMGLNHNYDAVYRQIKGVEKQIPETLQKLFRNSDFTGDSRILKLFKLSATDLEEFRQYRDYEEEGEVGKAMRQMVLGYNYLAHFAENDDRSGDNMFFKVMGPEGMEAFYHSLAADALSSDTLIKADYKKYVDWMLEKEKEKHPDQSKLIDEARKKFEKVGLHNQTEQGFTKGRAHIKKAELNIRLDYMTELEALRVDIAKEKLGRELYANEKEEIAKGIREDVAKTIEEKFLSTVNKTYTEKARQKATEASAITDKKAREKVEKEQQRLERIANASQYFTSKKEKFALDLVGGLLFYERARLNFFNDKKPEEALEKLVKKAVENGACRQRKMSDDDAAYAGMWAWRFRNWTGIAARNDTYAVGFDAWSKIMNFKDYRIRGEEGRTPGGNRHTIPGLKRASLTMWEGLDFRKEGTSDRVRLIDALQGGEGNNVNLKEGIGKGVFGLNAMSDFADTHVGNSMKLFSLITEEMYMELDQLVSVDPTGRIMIDEKKFAKLRDDWYKSIRYTYDQLHFDYNKKINVWERVNQTDEHGHTLRNKKTNEALTKLEFKSMELRDYFFDHEVNNMGMYKRFGIEPGEEDRMGRNVWAYLIAKEIGHHLESDRIHHAWTIDQLRLIQQAFEYMAEDVERDDHGGHEHIKVTNVFYNKKEFNTILKHAGKEGLAFGDFELLSPFAWWDTKEAGKSVGAAGLGGFFTMIGTALKAAGPGSSGGGGGGGGGHGGGHGGGGHGGGHH